MKPTGTFLSRNNRPRAIFDFEERPSRHRNVRKANQILYRSVQETEIIRTNGILLLFCERTGLPCKHCCAGSTGQSLLGLHGSAAKHSSNVNVSPDLFTERFEVFEIPAQYPDHYFGVNSGIVVDYDISEFAHVHHCRQQLC